MTAFRAEERQRTRSWRPCFAAVGLAQRAAARCTARGAGPFAEPDRSRCRHQMGALSAGAEVVERLQAPTGRRHRGVLSASLVPVALSAGPPKHQSMARERPFAGSATSADATGAEAARRRRSGALAPSTEGGADVAAAEAGGASRSSSASGASRASRSSLQAAVLEPLRHLFRRVRWQPAGWPQPPPPPPPLRSSSTPPAPAKLRRIGRRRSSIVARGGLHSMASIASTLRLSILRTEQSMSRKVGLLACTHALRGHAPVFSCPSVAASQQRL